MNRCESCLGVLSGPNDDECKNPECEMYVASTSPPAMSGPRCSCGGQEDGTGCSPDCELQAYYEDQRDRRRDEEDE